MDDPVRQHLAFDEAIMDCIHDIYARSLKDMLALKKQIRKYERKTTYMKYIDQCARHLRSSKREIEKTNNLLYQPVELSDQEWNNLLCSSPEIEEGITVVPVHLYRGDLEDSEIESHSSDTQVVE